jgi:hypothetical protein
MCRVVLLSLKRGFNTEGYEVGLPQRLFIETHYNPLLGLPWSQIGCERLSEFVTWCEV